MYTVEYIYESYIWPRVDTLDNYKPCKRVKIPPNNEFESTYEKTRGKIQEQVVVLRKAFSSRPFWKLCDASQDMDELYGTLRDDIQNCLLTVETIRRDLLHFQHQLMDNLQPLEYTTSFFDLLPAELVSEIVEQYLDIPCKFRLAMTCNRFYELIVHNEVMWKNYCRAENIVPEKFSLGRICSHDPNVYMEIYIRCWLGKIDTFRGHPCSICRKNPAIRSIRKCTYVDSNVFKCWKFCSVCQQTMFISKDRLNHCGLEGITLRWIKKHKYPLQTIVDVENVTWYYYEDLLELALKKNK